MADTETIEVYESQATAWVLTRDPRDLDHVSWVAEERGPGPVIDIGCGPGWHIATVEPPTVALDATAAMLRMVPERAPDALRLRGSADALTVATGSLGGAVATRVYLHLSRAALPVALADLHRALQPEAPAFVTFMGDGLGPEWRAGEPFAGRLFTGWPDDLVEDVVSSAGFDVDLFASDRPAGEAGSVLMRLRRAFTLPDYVGADMRLLVCGLNPSTYSAEMGVGFGRPGNRFWPAAEAAGLIDRARDPRHALVANGIGMTDLVKRPTRRAAELTPDEYRSGLTRVERLANWLQPAAVCFVGLAGWRAAVDPRAVAGRQPREVGGRPVYLMPSTSGLNARSQLPDLIHHLGAAARLADASGT